VDWLTTLRNRLIDLRNDLRLAHITIFKNHGRLAGATQQHPHSQIIALPTVPSDWQKRLRHAHRYFLKRRQSVYDAVLEAEMDEGIRVVAENDDFLAIAPWASEYAFEVMIVAKHEGRHSLATLSDNEMVSLAAITERCIKALYRQLGVFDFNILLNTPPVQKNVETEEYFDAIPHFWRFSLRIVPRIFGFGGFELQSGSAINVVEPEEAAELLRVSIAAMERDGVE
jgi:UDPglucose--hexose-1-phosphate uridylyltransferase